MTRRRLYLMRHGAVSYFDPASGAPLPAETVPLTAEGLEQARAAGRLFAAQGVRFDRVICSGLPRTRQTAAVVLAELPGPQPAIEEQPALREIHGGRLRDIAPAELDAVFTTLQRGPLTDDTRFLGGESLGELLDRALPAAQALLAEPWDCALWVLHGVVNAALLSHWVSGGQRILLPGWQQDPACINIIDLGGPGDALLRAVNLNAQDLLRPQQRLSTMEKLLADFRRARG